MKKLISFKKKEIYLKKEQAFTLIELMVAMGVGIFLLGAMTKVMLQNKDTARTQTNVEKIQDDARFGMELIAQDVRLAGFRGCVSSAPTGGYLNFKNATTSATYQGQVTAIQPFRGMGSSFSPALNPAISGLSPAPNPQFDVITVRVSPNEPLILTTDLVAPTDVLKLSGNKDLTTGRYAVLSNCAAATLFRVNTVSGNNVTSDNPSGVGYLFPIGSQLYLYDTITYYVGTVNAKNYIYKQVNGQAPQQVIDNVDKFEILYGIDSDTDFNSNQYVHANAVTNPQQIISLRMGLVVRANDNRTSVSPSTENSYKFNGNTVMAGDTKLRKVYYTTVNVRNMVP